MDAKYLAEIRARGQMAKAEKQKGNDLDCACLSWAIVLNDLPALLAEAERLQKCRDGCKIDCLLEQYNQAQEQISKLKAEKARAEKALELACRYHRFDDFKTVRSEIEFFAQQAQEQEAEK